MNELAVLTIKAHGGLKRWGQFDTVSAHLVQGGALWALKGQAGTLDDTNVTVGIRSEWASHAPFGASGATSRFEPHRVALESPTGEVLEEREPRATFAGHTLETPWSAQQLAYFAGCAMWTYLNVPASRIRASSRKSFRHGRKMEKPGDASKSAIPTISPRTVPPRPFTSMARVC
jgi:hypothetical protein